MDLSAAIKHLRAEQLAVEETIAYLERIVRLQNGRPVGEERPKKRGRPPRPKKPD
jgi:hypothetical protein